MRERERWGFKKEEESDWNWKMREANGNAIEKVEK